MCDQPPLDALTAKLAKQLKAKLQPFLRAHVTPELRGELKHAIMQFFLRLPRERLPVNHPYMLVTDVEVIQTQGEPGHYRFRFTNDRGEVIKLPI